MGSLPGLKTSVWVRLGVTAIMPGAVPAAIGPTNGRTSVAALTIYTPAPLPTLFVMNARYLTPLVCGPLDLLPPQLSHSKLAASRNRKHRRIGTLFKPGTPTSCRIIAWMQELRIIAKEEIRMRARLRA